jgi:hypothetical protein
VPGAAAQRVTQLLHWGVTQAVACQVELCECGACCGQQGTHARGLCGRLVWHTASGQGALGHATGSSGAVPRLTATQYAVRWYRDCHSTHL